MGLAIGVVGLFSTFYLCHELLERAASKHSEYKVLHIKLQNQHFQLERWRKSIHLNASSSCTCPVISKKVDGHILGIMYRAVSLLKEGNKLIERHDTEEFRASATKKHFWQLHKRGTRRRRIQSVGPHRLE